MSCLVLHLLLVDIVRVCVADVPVHHPQRQEQKQVPQGQGVAHQVSLDRLLWETPDVLPPLGRSEVLHGQQAVQGEGVPEEPGGGEIQTHFSTDVSKRGKKVFFLFSYSPVPPVGHQARQQNGVEPGHRPLQPEEDQPHAQQGGVGHRLQRGHEAASEVGVGGESHKEPRQVNQGRAVLRDDRKAGGLKNKNPFGYLIFLRFALTRKPIPIERRREMRRVSSGLSLQNFYFNF